MTKNGVLEALQNLLMTQEGIRNVLGVITDISNSINEIKAFMDRAREGAIAIGQYVDWRSEELTAKKREIVHAEADLKRKNKLRATKKAVKK